MQKSIEKFIELVKTDLIPKIICGLLAIILWAYISITQSGDIKFKIPVSFKNLNKKYSVSKMSEKSLTVKFTGKPEELKNTSLKNLTLYVDLSKPDVGKYKLYSVRYVKSQIPEDVGIDLSSTEIKVLVEKKIKRRIRVVPVVDISLDEGYIIGKIRSSPEFITVEGAESHVSKLREIKTETITSGDGKSTIKETVNIDKNIDNSDNIDLGSSTVNIFIPVIPVSEVERLKIPVTLTGKKDNLEYELITEYVDISVHEKDGDSFDDEDFRVVADLSGIQGIKENESLEVEVPFVVRSSADPKLNRLISVKPEKIKIKLTKKAK